MPTARDVMHAPAPAVPPEMTVQALYDWLRERDLDGACVVEAGELLGVVTTMDLVYRDKALHLPTFFVLLDAVLPIGGTSEHEVRKITGRTVADICTRDVVTVPADTDVRTIASRMVEEHLSVVPVVDGERLLGMITKDDVLRAHFG